MNQQNAESKLEQAALDNCVCKTGDCVHYNSFIRGANWQSLTTPASNEVEVLINEFYELYRKFEKDPDEDEHPYNRGVRVGKSITYANVVNRMREFLNSIATPSKPHTVEEGQTQEPVGGMKEMETFERMKKIQIWADEDSSKFQNACRDLGFDATDGAIAGRSGGYTQAIKDIFSNPTKFGLTPPPAPIKTEGEDDPVKYVAVSPNDTELIQGWYKDAKGNNFQLIKFAPAPPSPVGIDFEVFPEKKSQYNQLIDVCQWLTDNSKDKVVGEKFSFAETANFILDYFILKAGYSASLPQSSTEEENLFVEWVGQTFVRMHGGWLYRYESQINPDLKTTNQLREKWEEIKRLSGRQ